MNESGLDTVRGADLNPYSEMEKRRQFGYQISMDYFMERISRMNRVFEIGDQDTLTDLGEDRLKQLHTILSDEVDELSDILSKVSPEERMVELADFLADIVVYATSEAKRWGIPLAGVLHLVMDSQDTKLVDGMPIKCKDTGKFLKGPRYKPPEELIRQYLFGGESRELNPVVGIPGVILVTEKRLGFDGVVRETDHGRCDSCQTQINDELLKRLKAKSWKGPCAGCSKVLG